ncbi:mitochondrial fission process protein 1-like isoform X1 [Artemia franciscana]|uniref:mitochondrial fission process protein 1-like isoform X1 n=1 Tax=Artemia franciscana TaxID=6661 RepID=UPI0032DB5BF9
MVCLLWVLTGFSWSSLGFDSHVSGYANEFGEAFRSHVPLSIVKLSYGISSAYVLADACNTGLRVYKKTPPAEAIRRSGMAGCDVLVWQAFASVIIPGITINRIVAGSTFVLQKSIKIPINKIKWISTIAGLLSIPIIIKPIDHFVDLTMDNSIRKFYKISDN